LGAVTVVVLVCAGVLSAANHQSVIARLGKVPIWVAFGLVDVVVAWHQPRNPMGWLLMGLTFLFAVDALGSEYAIFDYRLHGRRLPLGWAGVLVTPWWAPACVLGGLALMLFPDGRILYSAWKPLLWVYAALGWLYVGGGWVIALGEITGHHISVDSGGGLTAIDVPRGPDAWFPGAVQEAFLIAVAAPGPV
jgi:hypothetical protein